MVETLLAGLSRDPEREQLDEQQRWARFVATAAWTLPEEVDA